jgi:hypothetical protein
MNDSSSTTDMLLIAFLAMSIPMVFVLLSCISHGWRLTPDPHHTTIQTWTLPKILATFPTTSILLGKRMRRLIGNTRSTWIARLMPLGITDMKKKQDNEWLGFFVMGLLVLTIFLV